MFISKIDGSEYEKIYEFNSHLRKQKITQKNYYETYEPRVCKQTGVKIEFKDIKNYFKTDFINKESMNLWLKANPVEAKDYVVQILSRRKEEKGLVYTPCEMELKSAGLPDINFYIRMHKDYNKIADTVGLKGRFDYSVDDLTIKDSLSQYELITDTREQLPIKFVKSVVKKLEYGDYNCAKKPKLCIDRKGLTDFVSSFFADLDRVEREIIRAEKDAGYLIFLCEESMETMLTFDTLPIGKRTKVKPAMIFRNIRDLMQRYNHVQFGFCKGRPHMAEVMKKLFLCEEDVSKLDIQHLITKGVL